MENLELCNLNNIYYKQDKNRKYSVYHDPINNNLILFCPRDVDTDIDSVCNSIVSFKYDYLINKLNSHNNLIVHWSQVSGTTSDYIIYYDYNVNEFKNKSYKEITKILSKENYLIGWKYQEVKNGSVRAITREEMVSAAGLN